MSFISIEFIIFLLIFFPIYFAINDKYKWYLLLLSSYIFYSFSNIKFFIFLLISTISTFFISLLIEKINNKEDFFLSNNSNISSSYKKQYIKDNNFKKNILLYSVIIINLGMIFFFKFNDSFHFYKAIDFILPLGISFYTLQALGYTIDVHRKLVKPEKNIFKYALFVSYFPQFIMGPISKFNELSYQFFIKHSFNKKLFVEGIERMLWGFFKKLVIADRIEIFVNSIFNNYTDHSGIVLFITIILYSFQIYADFSGYMDIAVGVSKCFGINIRENFKSPYFSASIQEFWTRWHITFYNWIKDYMFYPLVRSKYLIKIGDYFSNSPFILAYSHIIIAVLISWTFVGLWHGIKLHYVVASTYQAILLIICILLHKYNIFKNLNVFIKIICTFILVSFGHFLLMVPSTAKAIEIIHKIFIYPISNNIISELITESFYIDQWFVTVLGLIVLLIVDFIKLKNKIVINNIKLNLFIIYLLLLCIVICGKFGPTSFIYFRF